MRIKSFHTAKALWWTYLLYLSARPHHHAATTAVPVSTVENKNDSISFHGEEEGSATNFRGRSTGSTNNDYRNGEPTSFGDIYQRALKSPNAPTKKEEEHHRGVVIEDAIAEIFEGGRNFVFDNSFMEDFKMSADSGGIGENNDSIPEHDGRRRRLIGAIQAITSERNHRECGEVIDTVYPGTYPPTIFPTPSPESTINFAVNAVVQFFGAFFQGGGASPLVYDDFYQLVKTVFNRADVFYQATNGFKVMKICAKCDDVKFGKKEKKKKNVYEEFCGSHVYGADATFSGLVLLPVDDDGNILEGALKGVVWSRGIQTDGFRVPSLVWPSPAEGGLAAMALDPSLWIDYVGGMMTASSGYVTIFPDMMGCGESTSCFKGTLVKRTYQTSVIPLWYATQVLVADEADCSSQLVNSAIVSGFSEGGYATIAIAEALDRLGVNIIRAQAGAPPYRMEETATYLFEQIIAETLSTRFAYIFSAIGSSYASIIPDLPNFGLPGQGFVSDEEQIRVVNWLQANMEITDVRLLSVNLLNLGDGVDTSALNDVMVDAVNMGQSVCQDRTNIEALCQTIDENTLSDVLEEAAFPVEICHSPFDDLVPFSIPPSNPNVMLSPSLNQWQSIADLNQRLNLYIHPSSLGVCIVMQGFRALEDDSAVELSGKCKRGKSKRGKSGGKWKE